MRRVWQVISSRHVTLALRLMLGALFVYSGIAKMTVPAEFASDVANFRILPIPAVNMFALILPWLELLCGLSLMITDRSRKRSVACVHAQCDVHLCYR